MTTAALLLVGPNHDRELVSVCDEPWGPASYKYILDLFCRNHGPVTPAYTLERIDCADPAFADRIWADYVAIRLTA